MVALANSQVMIQHAQPSRALARYSIPCGKIKQMKSLIHLFLVAVMAVHPGLGHATEPSGKETHWLGGDLPPYIWQEDGVARGYGTELIAAISQRLGRKPDIEFFPWARAVMMAREGNQYAVLPLLRSPDREAQYQWLILLDHVKYSFFTRRTEGGSEARAYAQTLDGLRDRQVGVLRGSPIIKRLQAERFTKIVEETSYADLLRQLDRGVLDAVYAGYPMLSSVIQKSDYPPGRFDVGTSLGDGDLYIGASLKIDPAEAETLLKAYDGLRRDGTVARLRSKYSLGKLP